MNNKILLRDLDFSVRTLNFLSAVLEIETLDQLTEKTKEEIKNARNFIPRHLFEIENVLKSKGLTLKGSEGKENIENRPYLKIK